jgi:hypothetical protein
MRGPCNTYCHYKPGQLACTCMTHIDLGHQPWQRAAGMVKVLGRQIKASVHAQQGRAATNEIAHSSLPGGTSPWRFFEVRGRPRRVIVCVPPISTQLCSAANFVFSSSVSRGHLLLVPAGAIAPWRHHRVSIYCPLAIQRRSLAFEVFMTRLQRSSVAALLQC